MTRPDDAATPALVSLRVFHLPICMLDVTESMHSSLGRVPLFVARGHADNVAGISYSESRQQAAADGCYTSA